jgi:hypothetical protein
MGLHNFGCNRNDTNQAVASSVGTENRTDARLMKIFVIPRFTGCMTVERHGRVQRVIFFIFGRPQVQNPSWSLVVPIEFFGRFSLVYAAHFNVCSRVRTRRLPVTRILTRRLSATRILTRRLPATRILTR